MTTEPNFEGLGDFKFDDSAPFVPSKDVDPNRIMDLDSRIMRAMYMRKIDESARDVMAIMEEFTKQEICALLCKLIGATYYPEYMAWIRAERFNWQMARESSEAHKKGKDKGKDKSGDKKVDGEGN